MSDDPVNPSQYHGDLVARIIERFDLNFNLGNVAKYLLRHKNKNGIWGPKGTRPIDAPDIRAGFAYLMAGIAAKGKTTVRNGHYIDRGHEAIEKRLSAVGVSIQRITT
jgi:UDP-N-acetylglucosamine enolpyruvyl transferase